MSYNGRIPIAGCVTSRRDHGGSDKLKKISLRTKQEEADKALKQSQEEVLQYLKDRSKYKPSDSASSEKDSRKETSKYRKRSRSRKSRSRSRGKSQQRSRPRSRHRDIREDERQSEAKRSRKEESYGRRDERETSDGEQTYSRRRRFTERNGDQEPERNDPPNDLASTEMQADIDGREANLPPLPPLPPLPAAPPLPEASWTVSERNGPSAASSSTAFFSAELRDSATQVAERRRVMEEKARVIEEWKGRKSKFANVFGVEDDDDDDDVRRELEAAAKKKKPLLQDDIRPESFPSTVYAAAPPDIDMHTALKKMADFKRSCAGAPRPMPPELQAMASAMFGQGGRVNK